MQRLFGAIGVEVALNAILTNDCTGENVLGFCNNFTGVLFDTGIFGASCCELIWEESTQMSTSSWWESEPEVTKKIIYRMIC